MMGKCICFDLLDVLEGIYLSLIHVDDRLRNDQQRTHTYNFHMNMSAFVSIIGARIDLVAPENEVGRGMKKRVYDRSRFLMASPFLLLIKY